MIRIFTGICLLIAFSNSAASGQKMPSDYFEEGVKYVEDSKYSEAIQCFRYIVANCPKNKLYPKATYNLGYCFLMSKQGDSALVIFKEILTSSFNEREKLGGGIMDDPYTNYKHRASELISDIFYKNKMFDSALFYFAQADTVFPYLHFCGNEYAQNDVRKALIYADLYKQLGNKGDEIEALLPVVFITLADNSKAILELQHLLNGRQHLKDTLDIALTNYYSKVLGDGEHKYKRHYFRFLSREIELPGGYEDDERKFNRDKVITNVKQSDFYKMIEGL